SGSGGRASGGVRPGRLPPEGWGGGVPAGMRRRAADFRLPAGHGRAAARRPDGGRKGWNRQRIGNVNYNSVQSRAPGGIYSPPRRPPGRTGGGGAGPVGADRPGAAGGGGAEPAGCAAAGVGGGRPSPHRTRASPPAGSNSGGAGVPPGGGDRRGVHGAGTSRVGGGAAGRRRGIHRSGAVAGAATERDGGLAPEPIFDCRTTRERSSPGGSGVRAEDPTDRTAGAC